MTAEHEPDPVVGGFSSISLCRVCSEKVRRTADGWEHFGVEMAYEVQTIAGPAAERAVHTFTVTIESDDEAEWLLDVMRRAIPDQSGGRAVKVEHVHSRFPSGMMAYPKRDGS